MSKTETILVIRGSKEYQFVDTLNQLSDEEWISSDQVLHPNYVERGIKGVVFILELDKMVNYNRWGPPKIIDFLSYIYAYWMQRDVSATEYSISPMYVQSVLNLSKEWRNIENERMSQSIFFLIQDNLQEPNNRLHDCAFNFWVNLHGSTNRSNKIGTDYTAHPNIFSEIEGVINIWYKRVL